MWSGYGPLIDEAEDFEGRASVPTRCAPVPILELPWREYQLFVATSAGAGHSSRRVDGSSRPVSGGPRTGPGSSTEIDLPVTYVGGSQEIIDRLLQDPRLETTRSEPDFAIVRRLPPWLASVVDAAHEEVIATGTAEISLSTGTVSLTMEKSSWHRARLSPRSERTVGA